MNDVFTDPALNDQFEREGYVILRKQLDIDFKKTYDFFNALDSRVDSTFYSALWSPDTEFRSVVDSRIKEILGPVCSRYLKDYKPFFSDLLVKRPSLFEKLNWHQDWTFVDESKFTQVFIWSPLQDVTRMNGCMMILPHSHKYFRSVRGSNIDSGLDYEKLAQLEKEHARYLELEKGDVLIFNQSLLHASPPNRSFRNRLAIGLYCIPQEAETYHFHYDTESKKYLQYQIDLDFILHFSDEQDFKKNILSHRMPRPKGKVIRETDTLNQPFAPGVYAAYEQTLLQPVNA